MGQPNPWTTLRQPSSTIIKLRAISSRQLSIDVSRFFAIVHCQHTRCAFASSARLQKRFLPSEKSAYFSPRRSSKLNPDFIQTREPARPGTIKLEIHAIIASVLILDASQCARQHWRVLQKRPNQSRCCLGEQTRERSRGCTLVPPSEYD